MTLLAAFAALLSRQSGQHDLVIGSPMAAPHADATSSRSSASSSIRWRFASTPAAIRASATLIARARETALGGFAHQDLPFDRLVDEIQPVRDLSRNPLFQVMFALQNAPMTAIDAAGPHRRRRWTTSAPTAQFDLVLDMWERPDGLLGVLEFSTALFDHATAARLIDAVHDAAARRRRRIPTARCRRFRS